ncbi:LuxR C-terminal-related transcriptional regulator [Pseudorhodobacter sp. W20_MBD10_FR17]|uniref:LuxR C-terminal-related transcriptional regulator n=1 Tax=Pseudorhodobacter sp. W20_MBD10_FR17 TaxID=3240266 RepID=UPI003F9C6A17
MNTIRDVANVLNNETDATDIQKKITILIADDHVLLAESVAAALAAPPRQFRAQIVSTFDETLAALSSGVDFDLVMLDLKMPGMMGLKSVIKVIETAKPTWVVLLSGNVDQAIVQAAIDNGGRGWVPKTLSLRALVSVVDLVLSGQIFVPADDRTKSTNSGASGASSLSEREIGIMQLASEGRTNKEIASAIGASEVTIKMHMRAICRKLNARNRAHAVIISKEWDII